MLCHSIRENILNGELGASEDDVIAAAKAAHIHDFIMTLDKGYESQVCHARAHTHASACVIIATYVHMSNHVLLGW